MEYYILQHDSGSENTGRYPQVLFKNPKNIEPNPGLTVNLSGQGKFPPDDLFPIDLEMNKGSKITDLMSSDLRYNGFIISERLKDIFEKVNVRDCRYYKVKLLNKKKEVLNYYYFHSASLMRDYVDFSRSTFCVKNTVGVFQYDIPQFNSYKELKTYQETIHFSYSISAKTIYLKPEFPFHQHLFRLMAFNNSFFITGKLKELIEENNITGVHIRSADNLIQTPNLS